MGGACNTYGGEKKCLQVIGGEIEGKRPLGRNRCRRENNIKVDLQEVGSRMNWIDLAKDRDGWRVMNLQVP